MPRPLTQKRFKSRREAERALAEIIRDGGRPGDFTIDANPRGECLILIHETGTGRVAGCARRLKRGRGRMAPGQH